MAPGRISSKIANGLPLESAKVWWGLLGMSINTLSRFHDGVKALVTTRLMKASTGQRRDQVYEYLCRPSGPAAALLSSFACVLGEL